MKKIGRILSVLLLALTLTLSLAACATTDYTVTFNTGADASAVASQTVRSGKTATKPTNPTKTGYTFKNWYTSEVADAEVFKFDTKITKDTTLYAQWDTAAYTVSFNTAGGSDVAGATVTHGGNLTRPATNPTRDKYTFAGWYSDEAYQNEYGFENQITANTSLYAKWLQNYYITYGLNEGELSSGPEYLVQGNKFENEPVASRENYIFGGWYSDAEYQNEYDFNTDLTGNVSIYAKWLQESDILRSAFDTLSRGNFTAKIDRNNAQTSTLNANRNNALGANKNNAQANTANARNNNAQANTANARNNNAQANTANATRNSNIQADMANATRNSNIQANMANATRNNTQVNTVNTDRNNTQANMASANRNNTQSSTFDANRNTNGKNSQTSTLNTDRNNTQLNTLNDNNLSGIRNGMRTTNRTAVMRTDRTRTQNAANNAGLFSEDTAGADEIIIKANLRANAAEIYIKNGEKQTLIKDGYLYSSQKNTSSSEDTRKVQKLMPYQKEGVAITDLTVFLDEIKNMNSNRFQSTQVDGKFQFTTTINFDRFDEVSNILSAETGDTTVIEFLANVINALKGNSSAGTEGETDTLTLPETASINRRINSGINASNNTTRNNNTTDTLGINTNRSNMNNTDNSAINNNNRINSGTTGINNAYNGIRNAEINATGAMAINDTRDDINNNNIRINNTRHDISNNNMAINNTRHDINNTNNTRNSDNSMMNMRNTGFNSTKINDTRYNTNNTTNNTRNYSNRNNASNVRTGTANSVVTADQIESYLLSAENKTLLEIIGGLDRPAIKVSVCVAALMAADSGMFGYICTPIGEVFSEFMGYGVSYADFVQSLKTMTVADLGINMQSINLDALTGAGMTLTLTVNENHKPESLLIVTHNGPEADPLSANRNNKNTTPNISRVNNSAVNRGMSRTDNAAMNYNTNRPDNTIMNRDVNHMDNTGMSRSISRPDNSVVNHDMNRTDNAGTDRIYTNDADTDFMHKDSQTRIARYDRRGDMRTMGGANVNVNPAAYTTRNATTDHNSVGFDNTVYNQNMATNYNRNTGANNVGYNYNAGVNTSDRNMGVNRAGYNYNTGINNNTSDRNMGMNNAGYNYNTGVNRTGYNYNTGINNNTSDRNTGVNRAGNNYNANNAGYNFNNEINNSNSGRNNATSGYNRNDMMADYNYNSNSGINNRVYGSNTRTTSQEAESGMSILITFSDFGGTAIVAADYDTTKYHTLERMDFVVKSTDEIFTMKFKDFGNQLDFTNAQIEIFSQDSGEQEEISALGIRGGTRNKRNSINHNTVNNSINNSKSAINNGTMQNDNLISQNRTADSRNAINSINNNTITGDITRNGATQSVTNSAAQNRTGTSIYNNRDNSINNSDATTRVANTHNNGINSVNNTTRTLNRTTQNGGVNSMNQNGTTMTMDNTLNSVSRNRTNSRTATEEEEGGEQGGTSENGINEYIKENVKFSGDTVTISSASLKHIQDAGITRFTLVVPSKNQNTVRVNFTIRTEVAQETSELSQNNQRSNSQTINNTQTTNQRSNNQTRNDTQMNNQRSNAMTNNQRTNDTQIVRHTPAA